MSVTVLSIEVKLEKVEDGEGNKIHIYIRDPIQNQDQDMELLDDDDKSFAPFTEKLTGCLTTLQSILPHKSHSFFKSKDQLNELLENTKRTQLDLLERGLVQKESEKVDIKDDGCPPFQLVNGVDEALKTQIDALIQSNDKTNEQLKTKEGRIDFITKAVKKLFAEKNDNSISNRDKSIEHLDCARYLGEHNIEGTQEAPLLRSVFITKDGVITDGYIILPFVITDGQISSVGNSYITRWKLFEDANPVIKAQQLTWQVEGDTSYDIAVNLLKKYKTYETDKLTDINVQKGTCTQPFEITTDSVKPDTLATKLKNLVKPMLSKADIDSAVDTVVEAKSVALFGIGDDKEQIKQYNKTILGEKCTTYLGAYTIGGISNTKVFLTKDGIITDGFAILPMTDEYVTNEGIVDPDSKQILGVGQYMRTWKLANKNKLAIPGLTAESTEYDIAVKEMKEKGTYNSILGSSTGFGGGGNLNRSQKTPSNKLMKKRFTRRLRK